MGSAVSQSDWQVDSTEVQSLVNALKNYIRKPNLDYHRRRSTFLLVTAIAIAVVTAVLETMFSMLSLPFLLILVGGASLTITFLVWSYSERVRVGVSVLSIDWPAIVDDHRRIIESRLIKPSNMLVVLYAVKLLYGEDPNKEKPKVEEFEPGPYCGRYLRWHITLPLNSSTVEVWKGFKYVGTPDQYFVIIGNQYDRINILRAFKYYLYTEYNYIEGQDYYTSIDHGYNDYFLGAAKVEMKLCQERDKIPEKIARGEKIPIPPSPPYD